MRVHPTTHTTRVATTRLFTVDSSWSTATSRRAHIRCPQAAQLVALIPDMFNVAGHQDSDRDRPPASRLLGAAEDLAAHLASGCTCTGGANVTVSAFAGRPVETNVAWLGFITAVTACDTRIAVAERLMHLADLPGQLDELHACSLLPA